MSVEIVAIAVCHPVGDRGVIFPAVPQPGDRYVENVQHMFAAVTAAGVSPSTWESYEAAERDGAEIEGALAAEPRLRAVADKIRSIVAERQGAPGSFASIALIDADHAVRMCSGRAHDRIGYYYPVVDPNAAEAFASRLAADPRRHDGFCGVLA